MPSQSKTGRPHDSENPEATVTRSWALSDLLTTLFERKPVSTAQISSHSLQALCAALYSGRGEVSGVTFAAEILARLTQGDTTLRREFFRLLADHYDLDPEAVGTAAAAYAEHRDAAHLERLHRAAEPPRQELLRRLNQAPGGTAALVALRVELLAAAREDPSLARVDLDFRHLFASWFNRGFLVLRQIGWDSPAVILERIIAYEAVHEIHSWDDLRARVQPRDRRCFAFFHPSMPDDPLIFVEVALTKGIPNAIAPILAAERKPLGVEQADTAVFYSISNCQAGLRGISFGNSLIKQVASVLSAEMAHLKTFVTLSPIPGLGAWLTETGADTDKPEALQRFAAQYLVHAKAGNGLPRDPVARFHLGNGAQIHAVHANADTSPAGLAQSRGIMVNYLYDLKAVEANHETFAARGVVAASPKVMALAAVPSSRPNTRTST